MDPSPRELPPPPGVTRSAPGRTSTPLPAAPFEWHAERMQNWLQAKAEEDRRVQEEERSLQETLKLERRKVEQAMLVESLRAGVPPQMIPFIFTSMSGGDNSQFSLEMTQQHLSQPPRTATVPVPAQPQSFSGPGLPTTLPPPTSSQPCLALPGELPRDLRLVSPNTFIAQPSQYGLSRAAFGPPVPHSSQSTAARQETRPRRSSPSLSFHHYVPPGQKNPSASLTKGQQEPGPAPNAQSYLRSEKRESSPGRKRKPQILHDPVPPPSSRSSEMGAKSSECSRQTLTGTSSSGDQSDVSSSHDSPAADHDVFQRLQGSTSTHATETMQPLRDPSPKGSLRKSTASRVQVKHKPRNQGQDIPEQHEKSQIEAPPDADDASHLSQDIGMSTHSSGTARIDKDNF